VNLAISILFPKAKMASIPTKLWWPTILSFIMPFICAIGAVADDE
jgi:hypothetical protein